MGYASKWQPREHEEMQDASLAGEISAAIGRTSLPQTAKSAISEARDSQKRYISFGEYGLHGAQLARHTALLSICHQLKCFAGVIGRIVDRCDRNLVELLLYRFHTMEQPQHSLRTGRDRTFAAPVHHLNTKPGPKVTEELVLRSGSSLLLEGLLNSHVFSQSHSKIACRSCCSPLP